MHRLRRDSDSPGWTRQTKFWHSRFSHLVLAGSTSLTELVSGLHRIPHSLDPSAGPSVLNTQPPCFLLAQRSARTICEVRLITHPPTRLVDWSARADHRLCWVWDFRVQAASPSRFSVTCSARLAACARYTVIL